MHARVSRGRRRKIDSLGAAIAAAVAALRLVPAVPLAALVGVALFLGVAPAAVVGAEVALGSCGPGSVDERTASRGGGSDTPAAGTGAVSATLSWFFVGAGEPRWAGELLVDGGCTNSAIGVGVDGSGAVVTILNVALIDGDAGADSVVVAGRANCSTEASISGGLSERMNTASDITGSGRVAAEPDVCNDGPGSRMVFLISAESAAPPLVEGTVRFVSTESSFDEAVRVIAVVFVFVMVLSTDDAMLFCLGGVVASGVGGCVR